MELPANWTTVVGALEGLLRAADKLPLHPDVPDGLYLMGVTGHAFHLSVDMQVSAEGPAEFSFHQILPLWEGTRAWFHVVMARAADPERLPGAREEAWRRIAAGLERGWPAIAYDFGGHAEYGLITGVRTADGERQLRGVQHGAPGGAPVDWFSLGRLPDPEHPWSKLEVITLVAAEPGMNHDAAELTAVRWAVDHAYSPPSRDMWVSHGLGAYDMWVGNLQMPAHVAEAAQGHAYCAQVYWRARQAAAEWLRAVAGTKPAALAGALAGAGAAYAAAAEGLAAVAQAIPWPAGADLADKAVRSAASDGLRLARRQEERAVGLLERALRHWRP